MALKKGNNQFQISFQLLEGKTFVKAIELVASHIFSYTDGDFREGNGTPLQYFCLENPMDGEAW